MLFVLDAEPKVFLPAPGYPQTLPSGSRWQRFLADCVAAGHDESDLPYPDKESWWRCHGFALSREIVLVFLGGAPSTDALDYMIPLAPLLAATVQGERIRETLNARSALAQQEAKASRALALQLDGARAELQQALTAAEDIGRQVHRQAAELSSIIETLPDAVLVCTPDGVIKRGNANARQLIPASARTEPFVWDEMRLEAIFSGTGSEGAPHQMERLLVAALRGEAQQSVGLTIPSPGQDEMRQFLVNAAPIRDEGGAVAEVVVVATDVTELQRLSVQKDVFLSIASHELRTPLTTTKAMFQLLTRRLNRLGVAEEVPLDRIMESIQRMERLISDLIEGSRIEAGKLALTLQPLDLGGLCTEIVETQIAALDRAITLSVPTHAPLVMADTDRMAQVISNLITNAAKYSAQEFPVELTLTYNDQAVRVAVTDRGVGIPAERLAHVFERFYRVPEVTVQSGSGVGLGLGLYIASNIVEQHHGTIGVESTSGKGSTFWFELPILAPQSGIEAVSAIPGSP
ncbi:MAG TPA: HAMP domain-containing sensor histidine kinase [Ktedonobacterales bacterium]|nr:HAMP domain-containing sensor histidine kinase [Ktedonobacterales bacterium]